jgi:hypothetical protein
MRSAHRLGIAAVLLLALFIALPGAGAPPVDPGNPFPPDFTVAYMYNNTPWTIRWVICSDTGGTTWGDLDPLEYSKFAFENVDRPRTLSVFSGSVVMSCRAVDLQPFNWYLADPVVGPSPVIETGPGFKAKPPVPLKLYKGEKPGIKLPKGAKEAPKTQHVPRP